MATIIVTLTKSVRKFLWDIAEDLVAIFVKKPKKKKRMETGTVMETAQMAMGILAVTVAGTATLMGVVMVVLRVMGEDEGKTNNNVTNNALFVGSTSELSKLIKQGFLNNKEKSDPAK